MKPCIRTPYFEVGTKNYVYGDKLLEYARAADAAAEKYDIDVLFICPALEVRRVAENTKHLFVLATYMDTLRPGRGCADILPEGLKAPEGREKPLGTAHAVWCAKELTEGCPIAVINADDFYGADAFRKMYDYLSQAEDDDRFRYCMVGYQVENTLTENGTVSRGVCTEDEHGLLAHIIERTSIHRDADGVIRYDADGDAPAGEIAPGTPVSLNLWGFTPSFLPSLDEGLRTFFAEKLPENPMKGEYYLPFAVDALIKAGKATAKVLKTSARWYGVTYREDKPVITAAVSQMTADGEYPEDL